jgi:alpha-galactosidase
MVAAADEAHELEPSIFEHAYGDREELVDIVRSIAFHGRRISSVNVPNRGHVPNLPARAALELPAVATARGVRPMAVPDFPDVLAAIVERRLASVELTVAAALEGDRDLVVEALLADGAVTDPDRAAALAAALIDAQAEHLPLVA